MRIFFDTVGCRLNQSEIERLANGFRALGHEIVGDPGDADLAVVNTCAVTVKAAADSRKKLRRAARKGAREVIATGCWATLYPEQARELEGVTGVVLNDEKESLISKVLHIPQEDVSALTLVREPLPGDRARTRAFVKVQAGCDNHCTYCLTRVARGKSQSRTLREVERDVQAAIAGGAREIVLTGVQLGAWGRDLTPLQRLDDLIAGVLSMREVGRLRLSSIEPWDFDPVYLGLWEDARLCWHLHIPLQSGNDRILKKMGRPIRREAFAELTQKIREVIPGIALTTDVIAGFPSETEDEFGTTLEFVKRMKFAGGHAFTYSPRPGTAAYEMNDKVPVQQAKARNAKLRKLFNEAGRNYRAQFIGKRISVLWESSAMNRDGTWNLSGLTDNYIRVFATGRSDLWNEFTTVDLEGHHPSRQALIGILKPDRS
jgi:threonylcarbamoyladenosine tRNA methylthiotransferase MtaB